MALGCPLIFNSITINFLKFPQIIQSYIILKIQTQDLKTLVNALFLKANNILTE